MCDVAGVGKFGDGKPEGCYVGADGQGHSEAVSNEIGLWIPTLEGSQLARENDWIIKGIKGVYSCKPKHRKNCDTCDIRFKCWTTR